MSTIIRASEFHGGSRSMPFNLEDMAVQGQAHLERVRAEAAAVVAAAKQEAGAVRAQAEQQGRAAGKRAGLQAVEQIVEKKLSTVLPALEKAVQDIHHAKQAWLRHWEACAVHVAAAIAERLVRRELTQHPEITLTLVREALELAAGSGEVQIHLNPEDHKAIGPHVQMLTRKMSSLTTAEIVADAEISPGGCRVETRFGIVDQQFESQLKRIEEELT